MPTMVVSDINTKCQEIVYYEVWNLHYVQPLKGWATSINGSLSDKDKYKGLTM